MRHPQTRMWFATRNGCRGMLRYLWRGVPVQVHRPVRHRPPSVPRGKWRDLTSQGRKRAKIDYLLAEARIVSNGADIRQYLVRVLNEPNLLLCHDVCSPCLYTQAKATDKENESGEAKATDKENESGEEQVGSRGSFELTPPVPLSR